MKFCIITHVIHLKTNESYFAYAPYVREMNLWLKYVDKVTIVAPLYKSIVKPIDLEYNHKSIDFKDVKDFNITSIKNTLKTIFYLPKIAFTIYRAMYNADHIHLRLPGNMGLLASIIQIFFPHKPKTVKYAGNWDNYSNQPWSYHLQKWIVSNTFLSRNMKVLVYGKWENQSKNIVPFFTATYSEKDIYEIEKKSLDGKINLIFVGTLTANKRPMLALETLKSLINSGIDAQLQIFGEGIQRNEIERFIFENNLEQNAFVMGNQNAETLKKAYQEANFLIFASQSEGWPKVVAEAMIWKCLPITTYVSCVPYMLDNGNRGSLVKPKVEEILSEINNYLNNPTNYNTKCNHAYLWSKEFTLEKFDNEIQIILNE